MFVRTLKQLHVTYIIMIKLVIQVYNSPSCYKKNVLFYKTLFISLWGITCVNYLKLSLLYKKRHEKTLEIKMKVNLFLHSV